MAHVIQRFLTDPCHTTLLIVDHTCMLGHERFHLLCRLFRIICIHNSCFQLIFSHCPVQSGKKCLETRLFVVLVRPSCSRCLVPVLADYSSTFLFCSTIRAHADSAGYVAPPRLASNCSSSCMAFEQRGGDAHQGCVF